MTERTRALLPLVQLRLTGRFNSITSSHRGESPMQRRFALTVNCLDKRARFFRNSPDMKTSIPPVLIPFALVCFALALHITCH
jgi:hypothetical protein